MDQLNLSVGYKFSPTQSELFFNYLLNKILGRNLPVNIIPTFDCFSCSPEHLPFERFTYGRVNEWYFFSSGSDGKIVVTTNDGYYQLTDQKQKHEGDQIVGSVRRYDFHRGRFPTGIVSEWSIQEFKLHPHFLRNHQQAGTSTILNSDLVACKVIRNVVSG
ncbi:NAC domain containing protein 90 [Euphorbia peplus]|nr:NAC domain containing protein 90 [Euphorbia peplus]